MINPFMRTDTYFKNGETFKRRLTGKEVASGFGGFLRKSWSKANFLYIFMVVLLIYVFSAISYFNWGLFANIFNTSTMIGVVAVGMGLIILLGDIDLSVGSMYALSILIGLTAYNSVISTSGNTLAAFFVILIVTIVVGCLLGFINGFFIGILKMPSFIVTLATMLIYRSVGQYIQNVISGIHPDWVNGSILKMLGNSARPEDGNIVRILGTSDLARFTIPAIIFILVAIIVWAVTKYTKFGRKIYAVGSNPKAASLVGIKTNWMKCGIYTIAGGLVGLAGFLFTAMNGDADAATVGNSFELYAIASAVLGGIAMSGGRGTIIGVIFGTAAFQTIDKIIAVLNLNAFLNDAIKGAILIIAIVLQVIRFNKQDFVYILQKFNLTYVPNKDLILEAEYKTKAEDLEKVYAKKISKINHNNKLSEDEIITKINALLDEKEAKLLDLKNKYDVLIEEAKVNAKVHDERVEINEKIATKKHEIQNQKQYDIYLLNNKKKELAPWQGDYYKFEKELAVEHLKLANVNNEEILNLKANIGMDVKQIESLREFVLPYADEANKNKVNAKYDRLLAKYNSQQEKINAEKEKINAKYNHDLEKTNNTYDALIEKHVASDTNNHESYLAKKNALEQRKKEKVEAKAQKIAHKNDVKKLKAEAKAKEAQDLASREAILNKRLEKILKERK